VTRGAAPSLTPRGSPGTIRLVKHVASLLVGLFVATLLGCGPGTPSKIQRELHTDDLPGILTRGTLRVLVEADDERYLPRDGDPIVLERDVASEFAERHGLEIEFVPVDRFSDLVPSLLEGKGDVIAANLTVTPERAERIAFTQPIDRSFETIVLRAGETPPRTIDGLKGVIGARRGTTFLETARQLGDELEDVTTREFIGAIGNEALIDSLAAGVVDYLIQDSNRLDVLLGYRSEIQRGPVIRAARPLAWAVRPTNPALMRALDAFLFEMQLLHRDDELYVEDLPSLKTRGRLRMITSNSASTYFLWRGRLMGFEYELVRHFAREQGLRLEVVVAPSYDDMLPLLLRGEGDLVAAFLTPTEARREQVAFSRPYHTATEVLVGRRAGSAIDSVPDLAGRTITVRESSSYWTHLEELRTTRGIDFTLEAAPEDMATEEILAAVGDGRFDLTVADSHLLDLELTIRDDIEGLLHLGPERTHAWAVHPANEGLRAAIDAYFDRTVHGLFYNVSYARYFRELRHFENGRAEIAADGSISPYDAIVRDTARRFGFDWRMVVAQMYQESRFDPEAKSWAGARGLMQVLPRTARELGIHDLDDPEQGIVAGLRYLDWVRDRFADVDDTGERTWFTLAGYNAGHGHVRDARRLARQLGRDPDRWFEHVEVAMLKLSDPEFHRHARHGFVRGREPVDYVRAIRARYRAYVQLLERTGR